MLKIKEETELEEIEELEKEFTEVNDKLTKELKKVFTGFIFKRDLEANS